MDYISQHVDILDALLSIVLERMNIKLPTVDTYNKTILKHKSAHDMEEDAVDLASAIDKQLRPFARLSIMMDLVCYLRKFNSVFSSSITGTLPQDNDSILFHTQDIESILSRDYGITEIHPMIYSVPKSVRGSHTDSNVLYFVGNRGKEAFEENALNIYKIIMSTLQYNEIPFPEEWIVNPQRDLLRSIQGVLYLLITTTTALSFVFSMGEFRSAVNSYKRSCLQSFLGEFYDESLVKNVDVGIDEESDESIVANLKMLRNEFGIETLDDIKQAVTQTIYPI